MDFLVPEDPSSIVSGVPGEPAVAGACVEVAFGACVEVAFGACVEVAFGACVEVAFGACVEVAFGACVELRCFLQLRQFVVQQIILLS